MFTTIVLALVAAQTTLAHMSIFTPAMYGWMNWPDDPQAPMINRKFEDWWFRGYTNLPTGGEVEQLTAGGVFTAEIACHVAWTKYGVSTAQADAWPERDACPSGPDAGPYHSSLDYTETVPDLAGVSGCALAIADKDDIKDVTMNDLTIFSVNQTCVYKRETDFQIPAAMPACSGSKCICAWFWLANYGEANFYMTGFDCSILQSQTSGLRAIGAPQQPQYVELQPIVTGPKLPIYAYNEGSTTQTTGNGHRPAYREDYGFVDGPQNDIFTGALIGEAAPEVSSTSIVETTTSEEATSSTESAVPTTSEIVSTTEVRPEAVATPSVQDPIDLAMTDSETVAAPEPTPEAEAQEASDPAQKEANADQQHNRNSAVPLRYKRPNFNKMMREQYRGKSRKEWREDREAKWEAAKDQWREHWSKHRHEHSHE